MSEAKRAYDMMRGYVNREWERIQGIDWKNAERELLDSLHLPTPKNSDASDEYEVVTVTIDPKEKARRVLGVSPTADFTEIRKAFEKLHSRSNPANFPEGSTEAQHAADIQKQVNWAYTVLTDGVDDTEKRFRSLEIE